VSRTITRRTGADPELTRGGRLKLVGAAQRQEAPANGLGQVRLGALLSAQRFFNNVAKLGFH
jgi:hypothetical protein